MYQHIIWAGIISAVLTVILAVVFRKIGEKGKAGNLYVAVRGGTPRAVGLAPFIVLIYFLPFPFNNLVAIMGFMAFLDDLIGRQKLSSLPLEWGQILRGLGMLLVIVLGYPYLGLAAILVALMIQPLNIADMQPGAACTSVITMSLLVILLAIATENTAIYDLIVPGILFAACLGYAPLDYQGKIMLGEVGNHSLAVTLGLSFYLWGGTSGLISLFLLNVLFIALIREKNLQIFLEEQLSIKNPTIGDYFMDVLTGGGLGDLIRKITFKNRQITINNWFLIKLGFRRLFYNPFAS